MGIRKAIAVLIVISILGVTVYLGYGAFVMNESSDSVQDTFDASVKASCEQQLSGLTNNMNQGDTQEIPEVCFQEGVIVTDKLSSAEPGDQFRKTSTGIETVE